MSSASAGAKQVLLDHIAQNYSPDAATVERHIAAIDAALNAATPGGTSGAVQYNDNGVLAGEPSFSYDSDNDDLTVGTVNGVPIQSGGSSTKFLNEFGTYIEVSATPAGADGNVQYNNSGVFGANAALSFNAGTGDLTSTLFNGVALVSNGDGSLVLADNGSYIATGGGGVTAHTDLTGNPDGDDHTQYWLTAGRAGAQNYYGSVDPNAQLLIGSTSHATKGPIVLDGSFVNMNTKAIKAMANPTDPQDAATKAYVDSLSGGGVTDHGDLDGLGDDDHGGYWLTAGRSGSKQYFGSTTSGAFLQIESTSHATKGPINLIGSYVTTLGFQIKAIADPTDPQDAATKAYVDAAIVTDHNVLGNLLVGDVHTQYWYSAGRTGNQTRYGSSSSGGQLTLHSTSHGTKGPIDFVASEIDVNFTQIKQLNDPTATRDAVNKQYADSRVFGQLHATSTSGTISSATGVGTWIRCPNTTTTSEIVGGVTTGGVSNRLVAPEPGSYEVEARVWMRTSGANTYDKLRRIRLARNEVGLGDTEIRQSFGGSATGTAHMTLNTEIIQTLSTGSRLEIQYYKEDSFAFVIEQIRLSIKKISAAT